MTEAEISAAEVQEFRNQYKVVYSVADFTPTVCALAGVRVPKQAGGRIEPRVMNAAARKLGGGLVEKMLLFCPDAVGHIQRQTCPDILARVESLSDCYLPGVSVMQCVTPVCYGTIFSGASPVIHGIKTYVKPIMQVETLFDVMPEAGKNVAIVAMNDCSIDRIFRGRKIDYYSLRTDEAIFQTALTLLSQGNYDIIVAYMSDYDHFGHHTDVFSEQSVAELHRAADRFEMYCREADRVWGGFNRLVAFVPDHGQHTVTDKLGTHGTHHDNIPEDMLVDHYYRIEKGK